MYSYDTEEMIIRIKKLKKNLGFTNEQLAEKSGVAVGTINKALGTETKEPSLSTVIKISSALGVSVNELIFGQEKKPEDTDDLPVEEKRRILMDLAQNGDIETVKKLADLIKVVDAWRDSEGG